MQRWGRRCFGGFLALALTYICIAGIGNTLSNKSGRKTGAFENREWVATSRSWFDRQMCNWFELCGTMHLNSRYWVWDQVQHELPPLEPDTSDYWHSGKDDLALWDDDELEERDIPRYVLDHAPYVHLFSGEDFWPCDLSEHLMHTSPHLNYTDILDLGHDVNVTNLEELNDYDGGMYGRYIYLQSADNVEERPTWLSGAKNIPNAPRADSNEDADEPNDGTVHLSDHTESQETFSSPPQEQRVTSFLSLEPSTNGRCGGSSGYTCKGSKFGKCCSIYGWCGQGDAYCGDACDAIAGRCNNPFEPRPRPHSDLRRRKLDLSGLKHKPSKFGKSSAPAILIVVKKPDGILDAFWFFFYSYNLGQKVFNIRFGNHVGDWEHTMIRFQHGKPQSVFLSEHDFGDAYHWRALEKYLPNPDSSGTMLGTWSNSSSPLLRDARRPVIYSAVGSHAMYARPGVHPYILPWGLLHDQTDRGPLWDPSLNFASYVYSPITRRARASVLTPKAPESWFHFSGHWGDKYYPLSDPRQYRLAGQYHYVNGPLGPRFKNLGRKKVCQGLKRCRVRDWMREPFDWPRMPTPDGDGDDGDGMGWEDGGLPGGNITDDNEGLVWMRANGW